MQLKQFTQEDKWDATVKWKEYCKAEKQSGGYYKQARPMYRDLKKIYHQMKSGNKIIDLKETIQIGGVHPSGAPKLAVASIYEKQVYCHRRAENFIHFKYNDYAYDNRGDKNRVMFNNMKLPTVGNSTVYWKAPVPLIPPQYAPKEKMDDLFILWEVDSWSPVAPVDPYLLRRLTNTHFVVLEGWDLTELERSVMAAHI